MKLLKFCLLLTGLFTALVLNILATIAAVGEEKCPVCNNKFEAMVLVSTTTFGGKDRDFCYDAAGDPHPLTVYPITCPRCLFSGYGDAFKPETKLDEELKKKILNGKIFSPYGEIKSPKSSDDFPAWVRYDLIAQMYQAQGKKDDEIADCLLRASWTVGIDAEPLNVITKELLTKAWDVKKSVWQKDEAAKEGRFNYEIILGKSLLSQLSSKRGEEKSLAGLVAIQLLRYHGENTLVMQILGDIKDVMPKEEFDKIAKYLNQSIKDERYFQAKALAAYEKATVATEGPKEKLTYTYLCGELNRRLENWDKAREHYEAAAKFKEIPNGFEVWIEEQKNLLPKK